MSLNICYNLFIIRSFRLLCTVVYRHVRIVRTCDISPSPEEPDEISGKVASLNTPMTSNHRATSKVSTWAVFVMAVLTT